MVDLDLAFGALDADCRPRGAARVGVGRDADGCCCDALGVRRAGGAGGEGEEDGGSFVGAGLWVFGYEALDGGRGFAVRGRERVVEGLEEPG